MPAPQRRLGDVPRDHTVDRPEARPGERARACAEISAARLRAERFQRLYEAERDAREAAERRLGDARRAADMEEKLLAIVGHDLRTPLAAIRMSAELLFRSGGLSREQARNLGRVTSSASRMARIIRDLLDFARVRQGGTFPLSLRTSDLCHLATKAVAELSAAHPEREIRLEARGAAAVRADPDRLLQVLTNLLANAVQHGPPDAPVRASVAADETTVVFRVHNDGPPVPAELQAQIFEPFRRGTSGGEEGSVGLGLFIVREIARAHGGAVELHSAQGEGTTFTLRLPTVRRSPAGAPRGRSPADLESWPAEG
jgi:signal transduction histidine kinase